MLPPHEGPEPGYIGCACVYSVCALKRASPPRYHQRPYGPTFSHPMASAVTPPRQLAPTVGRIEALAGVFIRTGSLLASGEHVVCGLVHRFDALNFISDNAGCFGDRHCPAMAASSLLVTTRSTSPPSSPAASPSTCSSLQTHLLSVRLAAGVSLAP